jgi:hypothetical protein
MLLGQIKVILAGSVHPSARVPSPSHKGGPWLGSQSDDYPQTMLHPHIPIFKNSLRCSHSTDFASAAPCNSHVVQHKVLPHPYLLEASRPQRMPDPTLTSFRPSMLRRNRSLDYTYSCRSKAPCMHFALRFSPTATSPYHFHA